MQGPSSKWDSLYINKAETYSYSSVLSKLAKQEGKQLKDMTIIILVDGIHNMDFSGENSYMKQEVDAFTSFILTSECVTIGVCAGTFLEPLKRILKKGSNQFRISLPVPMVDASKIEGIPPKFLHLAKYMGGHGRAIEALMLVVMKYDATTVSTSMIIQEVIGVIISRYPTFVEDAPMYAAPLLAAITRKKFLTENSEVTVFNGVHKTVEDFVSVGLFRWDERTRTINIPYVLLAILAPRCGHPALTHFQFDKFDQQEAIRSPNQLTNLMQWKNLEELCAFYTILKAAAFKGETVTLSTFYAGMKLSPLAKQIEVEVRSLALVRSTKRYQTKGLVKNDLKIDDGGSFVDLNQGNHIVLNGESASAGDGFHVFAGEKKQSATNQSKKQKETIDSAYFDEEYNKAATDEDLFYVVSSGPGNNINLEADTETRKVGLVTEENFEDYFGDLVATGFRR